MTLLHSGPPDPAALIRKIVEAVAEARDEDVTDLPPIGDVLDPEALAVFIESTTVPTTVALEFYDCYVEVDDNGDVTAKYPTDTS